MRNDDGKKSKKRKKDDVLKTRGGRTPTQRTANYTSSSGNQSIRELQAHINKQLQMVGDKVEKVEGTRCKLSFVKWRLNLDKGTH